MSERIDLRGEHEVDDVVLTCMDFRFRPLIAEWINEQLDGKSDQIAMAGATKAILEETSRDSALDYIGIAINLHHVRTLHIIDHIDCGAYGGSAKFGDIDEETTFHLDQIHAAKKIVQERFANLEIVGHIIGFDGMVDTPETA